jgi:hypothetical protein
MPAKIPARQSGELVPQGTELVGLDFLKAEINLILIEINVKNNSKRVLYARVILQGDNHSLDSLAWRGDRLHMRGIHVTTRALNNDHGESLRLAYLRVKAHELVPRFPCRGFTGSDMDTPSPYSPCSA